MGKKVFISYRRDDTAQAAGRLYDRLCGLIGKRNVFLDVGTIGVGENIEAVIRTGIARSNAVLILIGNAWCHPAAGSLQARLFDEKDYVRAEVKAALAGNAVVLPVLVDGAPMPDASALPDDIRGIVTLNAPPLRSDSFDSDADRIARSVLGLKHGELLWDRRSSIWQKVGGAIFGGALAAVVLVALALSHFAVMRRPIEASLGDHQTTILIVVVLAAGAGLGFFRPSFRP